MNVQKTGQVLSHNVLATLMTDILEVRLRPAGQYACYIEAKWQV